MSEDIALLKVIFLYLPGIDFFILKTLEGKIMSKIKKIFSLVLLFVSLFVVVGCQKDNTPKEGEISAEVVVYKGDALQFEDTFIIEDGSTVFELLDKHLELEYTDSEWGANISKMAYKGVIVTLGNQEYFAFYINDEYAVSGVSSTKVKDGETYKFIVTGW